MTIEFDALPWEPGRPGIRFKAVTRGGQRLRLLELARGFAEQHWCAKGHVGWVLDGEFELETPGGVHTYRAGHGVFLLPGLAEKHKVRVLGDRALLILVEPEHPLPEVPGHHHPHPPPKPHSEEPEVLT
jgi:hypothetical protein